MGDEFRHEDQCAHRDAICLCPVVQARDARISELQTESTAYLERAAAWSKEWQAENTRAIIAEKKLSASEARVSSLAAENAALRERVAELEKDLHDSQDLWTGLIHASAQDGKAWAVERDALRERVAEQQIRLDASEAAVALLTVERDCLQRNFDYQCKEYDEGALSRAVVEAAMAWDAAARVHQSTEAMMLSGNYHAGRMADACAALAAFRERNQNGNQK